MKRKFKRLTSLILIFTLTFFLCLNMTVVFKTNTVSAGSMDELWLMSDYNYMLNRGARSPISCAPKLDTDTEGQEFAYIPVKVSIAYSGGNIKINGEKINITASNGKTSVFSNGSVSWTYDGIAQTPMAAPAQLKDNDVLLHHEILSKALGIKTFVNYDTGLIVIGTSTLTYKNDATSLKQQIDELDSLIFEYADIPNIKSHMEDSLSSLAEHPRLMANQDDFDRLAAIYNKKESQTNDELQHQAYINRSLNQARSYFSKAFRTTSTGAEWIDENSYKIFCQPHYIYDENGARQYGKSSYEMSDGTVIQLQEYWENDTIWKTKSSPYGDGYDIGGRSNPAKFTEYLKYFGFAWQITREKMWADAFYLTAMEMAKWEHWGEGHFLNCADAATEYALGYDWIYPAFNDGTAEGKKKLRQMSETLFVLAVEVGYNSIDCTTNNKVYTPIFTKDELTNENLKTRKNYAMLHSSVAMGSNWKFNWSNNWQTVCISGMVIAALAIIEEDGMTDTCQQLMTKLLPRVNKCLYNYAPDGSYLESPGYWEYSTSTFMRMLAALKTATGKTYGFLNTVGLRDSYYFAIYITDSTFNMWNYHDSNRSRINCETFYMASKLFQDPNIAAARDIQLTSNQQHSINAALEDALFYSSELSFGGSMIELDYYGKNIETVTMRSGWDSDAMFVGLHTGYNNTTHGDIDSGNFYIATGNAVWFGDPGAESYNVSQFKDSDFFDEKYRYLYYKKSIIAHNTVFIVDSRLPRGQAFNGRNDSYAKIDKFITNENGGMAISDMTSQFNTIGTNNICANATRGMLFTNSRKTVVVQDEMSFKSPTDVVWSSEARQYIDEISEDGRTIYMSTTARDKKTRLTLVSDNPSLKFTIVDDVDTLFLTYNDKVDGLYSSTANGGKIVTMSNTGNPLAADPRKRITVQANDVTEFSMAIVFEEYSDTREVVGYTYTDIDNWQISDDKWVNDANEWIPKPIEYKYQNSDLIKAIRTYESSEEIAEKYIAVNKIGEIYNNIDKSKVNEAQLKKAKSYMDEMDKLRKSDNKTHARFTYYGICCMFGLEQI